MNNTLKTIFWIGLGYYAAKKLPGLNEKHIQEAERGITKAGNAGDAYYQKFKDFLKKKDNANPVIIVEPCPADIKSKTKLKKMFY